MAAKSQLRVVNFENELGQVIKPGDEVVIVTTGYSHRVSISKGTYLGRKGENDGVSCRVTEYYTKYRCKETGEDVGYLWYDHATKRGVMPEHPKMDPSVPRPHQFRWNSLEYVAANAAWVEECKKYHPRREEYDLKVKEVADDYESFKVPYFRHTTLQRNRIYKLDTLVFDLKL